jgi:hypothetical protein
MSYLSHQAGRKAIQDHDDCSLPRRQPSSSLSTVVQKRRRKKVLVLMTRSA